MSERDSLEDAAFLVSQSEQDRTLLAIHRVESALAKASGSEQWMQNVTEELESLEDALRAEEEESSLPDALLSLLTGTNPRRFGVRVHHLRDQLSDLIRQVAALRQELDTDGPEEVDSGDLRHRIGWVLRALHHYRARLTDLVYEAIERDLGER